MYFTAPMPAKKRGKRGEVRTVPSEASRYFNATAGQRDRGVASFPDIASARDKERAAAADVAYFDSHGAVQSIEQRRSARMWWLDAFSECVCPDCIACPGELHANDCQLWPQLPGFRPIMSRGDVAHIKQLVERGWPVGIRET